MQQLSKEEIDLLQNGGFDMTEDQNEQNNHQKKIEQQLREQISDIQTKNQQLRLENRALKIKQNFSIENQNELEKLRNENIQLKKLNSEFKIEKIRNVFGIVREMLIGLAPKDTYYQIKDIPEQSLQINEYLLIKIFELTEPYKQEAKITRLENQALKDEIKLKNEKLKQNLEEIENLEKLLRDKEQSFKKIDQRKNQGQEMLYLELEQCNNEIKELKEKLINTEQVNKLNRQLKEDIEIYEHKIKIYKKKFQEENFEKEPLKSETQLEILKTEKEMISKECLRLEEQMRQLLETQRINQEEQKREKQRYDQLFEELLQNQKQSSNNYEKRINENQEKQQIQQQQEINNYKKSITDLYEKQLRFLKESKDEIQYENIELKKELKQKNNFLQEQLQENKRLGNKIEIEMSEIKINYNLKSQDLERKTLELENLKIEKFNLDQESKLYFEKLEILKSEIYKIKSQAQEEISQTKAENLMLRRELDNYNQIEKEIDDGIMNSINSKEEGFLNILNQVPTSKNKRILQAIQLGKNLSKKQNELQIVQEENEKLKNELFNIQNEYQVNNQLVIQLEKLKIKIKNQFLQKNRFDFKKMKILIQKQNQNL